MITFATTSPDMTGTYLTYLWVSLAVIIALGALIWLGWRNRKRRQADVLAPHEIPSRLLEVDPQAAAEGMIIGTVKAPNYLDRIAVHELGVRTDGRIEVHFADLTGQADDKEPSPHGLAVFRSGARNWFIPAQQIQSVETDSGMIGKFVERDGIIVIGWTLGDVEVATGFRPRHAAEGRELLAALRQHVPRPPSPPNDQPPAEDPNL